MSAINDGGPAFPIPSGGQPQPGMSLRDWFAGQALAGMLGDPDRSGTSDQYAHDSVDMADATLAALGKSKPDPIRDELLALLKSAGGGVGYLALFAKVNEDQWGEWENKARAAIAKATGKESA